MKSKILVTTLVGLLFGLVACDKSQESLSTTKTDNKQVEQIEQKQVGAAEVNHTEKLEKNVQDNVTKIDVPEKIQAKVDVELKENKPELIPEQQSIEIQKNNDDELKDKSFEDKSKQSKLKKVNEKSETEKVLAILEKQYQNVRCAEGQESGYCLEESQRLKNEIERLKAQLGK